MITADQLDRAICGRRDERLAAALIAAQAAGLYDYKTLKIGSIGQMDLFRSVTADAAECLGIPVEMLDLSRESHLRYLTAAAVQLIRDEIAAAPGSTASSLSSYAQKSQ